MKKRSMHEKYVSVLKRLATQMSGLRRGFEMAYMNFMEMSRIGNAPRF
jgi:hypothetical protein